MHCDFLQLQLITFGFEWSPVALRTVGGRGAWTISGTSILGARKVGFAKRLFCIDSMKFGFSIIFLKPELKSGRRLSCGSCLLVSQPRIRRAKPVALLLNWRHTTWIRWFEYAFKRNRKSWVFWRNDRWNELGSDKRAMELISGCGIEVTELVFGQRCLERRTVERAKKRLVFLVVVGFLFARSVLHSIWFLNYFASFP